MNVPHTPALNGTDTTGALAPARRVLYVRALWKRRWMVAAVAILGCVAAMAWSTKQPRIYQADATIMYDPSPTQPLGGEVTDVASPMAWWESREFLSTQNKILTSRAIAEKVVRKLSLHENADFWAVPPEKRAGWPGASVSQTAQSLQALLTITPERETRIVHVLIKDRDPARSALIANTLVDSYIEQTVEDRLSTSTGALEWLAKQLDSLKSQLERSELALHDFTQQHSNLAVSLDDQQNIIADNIGQLSGAVTNAKTKRIELSARVEELKLGNSEDPFDVNTAWVLTNPAVQALRAKYKEQLTERNAVATNYAEKHPKVLALDAELATLRQQMRHEIDGLMASAAGDLRETERVEKGLKTAFDQANRLGMELNLQEISFRRLQRERDNTAKLYGTLLERTTQTDLTRALSVSLARVVDRALVPGAPISPRPQMDLAVGALLGLVLGIALALLLEQMDSSVRSVEDAEELGITILGVMPSLDGAAPVAYGLHRKRRKWRTEPAPDARRDLVVYEYPKSAAAECCRTIRTNLTFMSADRPRKTLVVTSASPREGKTTISMNLAIALAQSGKRVLLVDTDLRRPRIHRALSKSSLRGVTTVLIGEHSPKEAVQETDVPGLDFMASGPVPPNPSELLHTAQFRDLVASLTAMYDHVIFDSPPLAAVTDAAIIAPQVDGAILVIHGDRTSRDALRLALRQLADVHCHLIGGVLNDVDLAARRYGYKPYFYYYRGDGYYNEQRGGGGGDGDGGSPPAEHPVAQA